ncbi:MAG: sigma-70 family RNA polymerase sigma factor [Clostridia bacterium]|nr:sigma-70 family RNA polymerase sigma factor [Clostridia bacterium]
MNKNWSNTALVAYSALPKIVKELDFSLSRLVNSSFKSVHLKNGVSTLQLIGEIMDVTEEKRKIVNLRYIVSTALDRMSDFSKQILVNKIMKKMTFKEISLELDMPIRTVFRRFEAAQEEFAHNLKIAGFGENWLENEYGEDKFIAPIRERFLAEKYLSSKSL